MQLGRVKNKYPLPHISSAFESLQAATVFSKLNLRNAYHPGSEREMSGRECSTHPLGILNILVMAFALTSVSKPGE